MKKDKTPRYIKVAILTVVTTIAWIFFSAYRILTAEPTPNVPPEILAPFIPTLETEKISEIESRIFFEEGQASILIVPSPTSTPEIASPTPEAEPSPTPDAEESGIPETESPTPTPTDSEELSP